VGCLGCTASLEEQAAPPADPPIVRSAECRWTADPIRIDAELDEPAWKKAETVKDFAVFWLKRPARSATTARLLWDDRWLYFAAELQDSDLYGQVKDFNGRTWFDDVFELFFKPDAEKLTYYEFQVNVLNTRLELFLPSRGAGGYDRFAAQTRFGMESAVKLNGTLNDWKDRDRGWIVEGRIPWPAFAASGGRPAPGSRWRFALCRYDYSVEFDRVETSSSAPLTQPDFHRYEDYGVLTFVR
jgi:hypothetical protein